MKQFIFKLGFFLVSFILTQFAFGQTGNTTAIKSIDTAVDARLQLPPGFTATIVAEGVGSARNIAVNKQGGLYVKLSKLKEGRGIIYLKDRNEDGI
ncbi:MAG: sorbosone dehydrogenase, partial [Flavisolibacter sp.]|nr:sorbosone dehydrogenase [Flavisolibacter sp.]